VTIRFGGRVEGRVLEPASYRLLATLRTPSGGIASARFRVARG